jgi:hypothetical protein
VYKKSNKYLSLVLCFMFICGSMLYIPKKNEVKALSPVDAGIAFVSAIAISMGIYSTSQNASAIATDIYTNLPSDLKSLADSKSANVSNLNTSAVDLTRSQYNSFVQRILLKFGLTPQPTYTSNILGQIETIPSSDPAGLFRNDLPTVQTFSSYPINYNYNMGNINANFIIEGANTPWSLNLTCPDGYKIKLSGGGAPKYYDNWSLTVPLIAGYGSANPLMYIGFIGKSGITTKDFFLMYFGNDTRDSIDGGTTYNFIDFNSVYNRLMLHGGQPINANIDTAVYNAVSNSTSTDGVTLKVSSDMDKMVNLTAESIVATNNVGDNVLDIGADIVNGLNALGEFVVNGINAVTNTISSTVASIGEGVQSIVDSIAGAPTVAVNFAPLTIAGSTIATKFPFSIPFDLVNSVSALNVSGVAPHWQYTFPAGIYNGTGSIDIDFAQFEDWAKVVRWGMLISFSVGLILITRQIIGGE